MYVIQSCQLGLFGHHIKCFTMQQAYDIAEGDDTYMSIHKSVKAMIFLGTPYYGSSKLSDSLTWSYKLVSGSNFNTFVKELSPESETLRDINGRFEITSQRLLGLMSCYETRSTVIDPRHPHLVCLSMVFSCDLRWIDTYY